MIWSLNSRCHILLTVSDTSQILRSLASLTNRSWFYRLCQDLHIFFVFSVCKFYIFTRLSNLGLLAIMSLITFIVEICILTQIYIVFILLLLWWILLAILNIILSICLISKNLLTSIYILICILIFIIISVLSFQKWLNIFQSLFSIFNFLC